ncbi:hypothetical protein E2C01_077868 [Portunus trituberculatus]|uniref:Secreted protein n=1 Tax=Portunus trituberculatus TaxID=210409 RepID=A0A5B7IFJ8_PORTR|nr:hypothetical protein [Portunus trituberculatus]
MTCFVVCRYLSFPTVTLLLLPVFACRLPVTSTVAAGPYLVVSVLRSPAVSRGPRVTIPFQVSGFPPPTLCDGDGPLLVLCTMGPRVNSSSIKTIDDNNNNILNGSMVESTYELHILGQLPQSLVTVSSCN